MSASFRHTHAHVETEGDTGRLVASIILNLLITVAEVIGGILAGSLALLSDALHNLSDTASLVISLTARRLAGREATPTKTFGYRRAEIIGAFINLMALVFVAIYLIQEAIRRFMDPEPIDGGLMLVVAVIGLLANLVTAVLLYRGSRSSLNLRSAFLHIVTDGLSSLGVVFGGILILRYDLYVVDPIITLGISVYLLLHSYRMLKETIDILMEGTPKSVDLAAMVEEFRQIDRVVDVHHLHVWQLDEAHLAFEAHVVIAKDDLRMMEAVKAAVKAHLAERYDISHSTLEFETIPCDPEQDPNCYERPPAEDAALDTRSAT